MTMLYSRYSPILLLLLGVAGCDSGESDDAVFPTGPVDPKVPEAIPLLLVDRAETLLSENLPVTGGHAVFVDLDGDGFPDIAQPTAEGLRLFWNDGTGGMKEDSSLPQVDEETVIAQIVAADFDGSGFLDLLLLGSGEKPLQLLSQNGKRSFVSSDIDVAEGVELGHGVAADLDGDGDMDVIITLKGEVSGASGSAMVMLLVNDGNGKLMDQTGSRLVAPGLMAYGVAVGDLDGDGAVDLLFSGDKVGHRLLLNDGRGYFRDAPPDALPDMESPGGRIPALGDLNGDGALDILIPSSKANQVLLNDGNGRFVDETPFVLGSQPGTARVARILDLDQDTHADVVLAGVSSPFRILRNDGTGRLFDYSANMVPHAPSAPDVISVDVADLEGDGDLDLFVSRTGLARPWLLVNWYPESFTDTDGDNVPDVIDNCPDEPNPDQANRDSYHFSCASARDCKSKTGCTLALRNGQSAYLLCEGPESWDEARAFCQSRGADLVVIDSKEENQFLAESGLPTFWIGLTDVETEGTFLWVNGKTPTVTFWNEGEPNNSGDGEDCVALFTAGENAGHWNDYDCASERAFVCQDVITREPPDPGDACDVCPDIHDPDQKDSNGDGVGDACTMESL